MTRLRPAFDLTARAHVAVVFLLLTISASATDLGKNGHIEFVRGPDIFTMNPDGSGVRQLTAFTDNNQATHQLEDSV